MHLHSSRFFILWKIGNWCHVRHNRVKLFLCLLNYMVNNNSDFSFFKYFRILVVLTKNNNKQLLLLSQIKSRWADQAVISIGLEIGNYRIFSLNLKLQKNVKFVNFDIHSNFVVSFFDWFLVFYCFPQIPVSNIAAYI